eukprot:TRINITY_DN2435_c1_g1_i1.p1 TRINITY_DN2435_c1_g1~~TRINITY_DN2435_c1_g1_i1.p1  ORF type:complete len:333 (+),score=52.12 TRINITY_DN2435_c1_g1_i1:68-1066(+)
MSFKDQGVLNNPVAHPALVPFVPWWSVLGSQSVYGESLGSQSKYVPMEPIGREEQSRDTSQQVGNGKNLATLEKEGYDTAKFTISPGCCKDSGKEQKAQQLLMTILPQSSPPECQAHYELGLAQSMVCVNYPYMDKCYSLLATYGAQEKRVRMILPLNVTEDGPIYVNAKQYHGIIRRRQSRAKAELGNKLTKVRKPYLHESRHLHAMRRARGCGGRFLNTKKEIGGKGRSKADRASHGQLSQAAVSSYSTGVQSDGRNPSSEKETPAGSCLSGSEMICMYSRGDLDNFQIEHPRQSTFQGVSNVIDRGKSIGFPAKWVAVADGLCNVLKVG